MSASRDEKTRKWTVQCYYENWKGEKKHKKVWFCHEKRSAGVGKRISEKYMCQYGYDVRRIC